MITRTEHYPNTTGEGVQAYIQIMEDAYWRVRQVFGSQQAQYAYSWIVVYERDA